MDELWQRYRTFWTPVLIGLGVFLVGVIAVHVVSPDPAIAKRRMNQAEGRLRKMKQPEPRKTTLLGTRGETLRTAVLGDEERNTQGWADRIDQVGGAHDDVIGAAAEQALRAAVVRGADEETAANAAALASRFGGDDVAAAKAYRQFRSLVETHREALRTDDPNVAWSRLLSDVWMALRIRANRADVEIGPIAAELGFSSISSVSRATLPARVLNLALAARIADIAIRQGAESIDSIVVPTNIDPGDPEEFLQLWPIELALVGDEAVVKRVVDMLTDPDNPVPIDFARLQQPKAGGSTARTGLVQLNLKVSSTLVRGAADLALDTEEEK